MFRKTLTIILALALSLGIVTAAAQAAGVNVTLNKNSYAPNEDIKLTVSGITGAMVTAGAFVALYESGAPYNKPLKQSALKAGLSTITMKAPATTGKYEARVYQPGSPCLKKVPFSVETKRTLTTTEKKFVGVWRNIYEDTHGTPDSYYLTEAYEYEGNYLLATPEGTIYSFADDGTFYRSYSNVSPFGEIVNTYKSIETGVWHEVDGTLYLTFEAYKDQFTSGIKAEWSPWREPFCSSETLDIHFDNDSDGRGKYFAIDAGAENSVSFEHKYHLIDPAKTTAGAKPAPTKPATVLPLEVPRTPQTHTLSASERKLCGVWRDIYKDTYGTKPSYYLTKAFEYKDDYMIPTPEGTLYSFASDGTFYRTNRVVLSSGWTSTYTMIEKGYWRESEGTVYLTFQAFRSQYTKGFITDWFPWRPSSNPNVTIKIKYGNDNNDRGNYFEITQSDEKNTISDKNFEKKYHWVDLGKFDDL